MKLFKRRNRFLDACNNVTNNKKLYDSIVKLQNNLIVFTNSNPKVIAVAAPWDRVHCSLMAKAIAEVYAHNNKKTILIDLDMHLPTLDKLFKLENVKTVLDMTLQDYKCAINKINDNLDVIVSRTETYQADFLVSEKFNQVLMELKKNYDHVIVTLPPILESQDILLVKDNLDAALLVSKKNETMITAITKSVEFIKENNINFAGTIFIK